MLVNMTPLLTKKNIDIDKKMDFTFISEEWINNNDR